METRYDHLNLSNESFPKGFIRDEVIYFSSLVYKKNRFGFKQSRTLLITNNGLYNLKGKEMKRRIEFNYIRGITLTKKTDEFVIHCNDDEYDYQYYSELKKEIVEIIARFYKEKTGEDLKNFFVIDMIALDGFVTTKKEKRQDFNLSRMPKSNQVNVEEYLNGTIEGTSSSNKRINKPISKFNKTMKIEEFNLISLIGRGGGGKVYLAEHKNKKLYAIKSIRKDQVLSQKLLNGIFLEKEILSAGNCPFILTLEHYFLSEDRIYFVLPYLGGGDLYTRLEQLNQLQKKLDEKTVKYYGGQIALALDYLHLYNKIYRDLKLENVLIDSDGYLKLCDFGSVVHCEGNSRVFSYAGSPEYVSPEMVAGKGHDKTTDWWSFGVFLYELLFGVTPFANENQNKMFEYIQWGEVRFPTEQYISADLMDLIKKLLTKDPEKRLGCGGIKDIKEHPFFSDVNFEYLRTKKIKMSYKPNLDSPTDTNNFDEYFTSKPAVESPVDSWIENNQAKFDKLMQ